MFNVVVQESKASKSRYGSAQGGRIRLGSWLKHVFNEVLEDPGWAIVIKGGIIREKSPKRELLCLGLLAPDNSDMCSSKHCVAELGVARPDPLQGDIKDGTKHLVVLNGLSRYHPHSTWEGGLLFALILLLLCFCLL